MSQVVHANLWSALGGKLAILRSALFKRIQVHIFRVVDEHTAVSDYKLPNVIACQKKKLGILGCACPANFEIKALRLHKSAYCKGVRVCNLGLTQNGQNSPHALKVKLTRGKTIAVARAVHKVQETIFIVQAGKYAHSTYLLQVTCCWTAFGKIFKSKCMCIMKSLRANFDTKSFQIEPL